MRFVRPCVVNAKPEQEDPFTRSMTPPARRWASLAIVVAWAFAPGEAQAGASARLVYVRGPGAEGCPTEQEVRAAVRARLGYDPFFPWAHETLVVEIAGAAEGFRVQLQLIDADNRLEGARGLSVRQRDCAAAVDALALTISLTIDPASLVGRSAAEEPSTTPATRPESSPGDASSESGAASRPTAPGAADDAGVGETRADASRMASDVNASEPSDTDASTVSARVDVPVSARQEMPLEAQIGLGVEGSLGRAPGAALGGLAFGSLRWRLLEVDLQAGADLPATGSADIGPVRVQSWLISGAVAPCLRIGWVVGCGVATWGLLTATSVGATHPSRASAEWWALGPRAGLQLPLSSRVSLRAWGELLWAPTPDWLDLNGQQIFSFRAISGDMVVAVGWQFQ